MQEFSSLTFVKQNDNIKKAIETGISKQFPIDGNKHRLVLNDVWIKDVDRDHADYAKQREIKLNKKSWTIPAYADISLVDKNSGRVIDRAKRLKIAEIPKITNRFSVIVDGNEYQTTNQFRLKTGIYTRVKNNGQIESQFNLDPGFNFKMTLDPDTSVFYLNAANKKYHVYNILTEVFGLSTIEIQNLWGKKIFDANVSSASGKARAEIVDLYEKVAHEKEPLEVAKPKLVAYFKNTGVSPDTTEITLGERFETVDGKTLLSTSSKLLKVMRGDEPADERDSMIFKELYTVDDLLDQFFLKRGKELKRGLSYRLDAKDRVRDVLGSKTYGAPIKDFFTKSDLVSPPPQTNPVNIVDEWRKTTITGTGGITSPHAITMDVRNVHPSTLGFLDPINTPESGRVGVTLGLSVGADKYDEGIITLVMNKSGKLERITPIKFHNSYVGFPDEYEMSRFGKPKARNKQVRGIYKGKADIYPANKIEYYLPFGSSMFTISSNMIPFLAHNQGNRGMMGSRMMGQALAIDGREAPNIRVQLQEESQGGKTLEDAIGNFLNPVANEKGTVSKVTKDYIWVKNKKGNEVKKYSLANNFPLNQEAFLHSTPLVKPGDEVKSGQILAESNFNKDGHLALGKNVNVAYMPWHGYNFEDAAVVTESFAKEFSHESIIKKSKLISKDGVLNLKKFRAYFPDQIDIQNASILNDDGVVKEGVEVQPGQVIIAYMQKKDPTSDEQALRNLNRTIASPYRPAVVKWDFDHPGTITDVTRIGKVINVLVKVRQPLVVGDKIAGRHGNKSIISKIIKDEEAPHTTGGERIDLMLNPHGVPGRINVGQILETAAGKLVKTTGNPYVVKNFDGKNHIEDLKKAYKDNGLEFDEVLLDGKDGKPFKNKIFTGNQYILKLHHTVEHKIKARSAGAGAGGYDYNEQPSRGETGGQSLDAMQMYGLLAHGAKKNLYEMSAIKGQKNDEFWRALQLGLPLPPPQKNFAFEKMLTLLRAASVDTEKKGDQLKLLPLTDDKVLELSSGALAGKEAAEILRGKDLKPRRGGLFDEKITGGHNGTKWAHLELPFKIPNPMFEDAITKVTGMTSTEFKRLLKSENGAQKIEGILTNIDVKKEIADTKEALRTAPDSKVNILNKKVRYLIALDTLKMRPENAYMMSKVPVIPPKFRPIYPLPSGDLMVSPINKHYKDVALVAEAVSKEKQLNFLPGVSEGTEALYNSIKAMQGFIDPITYTREKYEGVMRTLAGSSPKEGFVQNRVWAKKQDISARSTITLEPSLGIDEVGLPDTIAKVIYKPFIIKKLIEMGSPASEALKEYASWTPRAERALEVVMEDRPVILNRAPTLHKHGVQAFKPKKITGKSIKLNPLIVSGFNADFDGDTMSVHVPIMPKAVDEAMNILPSKIIFKHGDNSMVPEIAMEYMLGLYYLTKDGKNTGKVFNTIKDAKDAGLEEQDIFTLGGLGKTSIGKVMVNEALPEKLRNYQIVLDKKTLKNLLTRVAKEYPNDFSDTINTLRDLGNDYSHIWGASISLTDMDVDRTFRDEIVLKTAKKLKGVKDPVKISTEWAKAKQEIKDTMAKKLRADGNRIQDMLDSGSAKKEEQATQMIMFPGLFEDVKGRILPTPFVKSYAEGFNTFDYWNGMYGVRKGAINTAVNTQETGALNKELLGVTKGLIIVEEDCDTYEGLEYGVDEKDVLDRYLAVAYTGVGNRDTIVDNNVVLKAKNKGLRKLLVRSPMTCESENGICIKCYGLTPNGSLPEVGMNVGIADSQALTERATQLTLQTRHTGGAAGAQGKVAGSFPRLRQLFDLPKTIPDQATVVKDSGKVTNIIKSPVGGYEVYINAGPGNNKKYNIQPGLEPVVKKNDNIVAGTIISTGNAKPQDIAEATDHRTAQRYIVDQMDDIYGNNFYKKTFETVMRGVSNNAVVTEAPDDSEFIRGDVSTITRLNKVNKERMEKGLDTIKFTPKFISIAQAPTIEDDWLSRLTTRYLKNTVRDGVARGMASNLHGTDPMPAYLQAEEFGKGKFY